MGSAQGSKANLKRTAHRSEPFWAIRTLTKSLLPPKRADAQRRSDIAVETRPSLSPYVRYATWLGCAHHSHSRISTGSRYKAAAVDCTRGEAGGSKARGGPPLRLVAYDSGTNPATVMRVSHFPIAIIIDPYEYCADATTRALRTINNYRR